MILLFLSLLFGHPTYTCFQDSMAYMVLNDERENIYLVHGVCKTLNHDYPGKFYFHSWVEVNDNCIYSVNSMGRKVYLETPRNRFYKKFAVLRVKKYSPEEAYDRWDLTHWYGPWKEDPGRI